MCLRLYGTFERFIDVIPNFQGDGEVTEDIAVDPAAMVCESLLLAVL